MDQLVQDTSVCQSLSEYSRVHADMPRDPRGTTKLKVKGDGF